MKLRPNASCPRVFLLIWGLIGCCGLDYSGFAQDFELLWSQPPAYLVLTNTPQMQGASRPSTIDWASVTESTNPAPWNAVVADDFRARGQSVGKVRWWGSYQAGFEPPSTNDPFEDAFVLTFFGSAGTNNQPRPGRPLAVYLAPVAAVHVASTTYSDSNGRPIYQYEVSLRDTLLDHASSPVARPYAFLPASNGLYWISMAAEAGLRLRPETDQNSLITNWLREYTGKRATNSFWGWQTAPQQQEGESVSGGVAMVGSNWVFATGQWRTNEPVHGEADQAFELAGGCAGRGPHILSISAECGLPLIKVAFDAAVDPGDGTDGFNYELTGTDSTGHAVLAYPTLIGLGQGGDTAFLWFSPALSSGTYILKTQNIPNDCLWSGEPAETALTIACPPSPPQSPPLLYLRVFPQRGVVLSWNNPDYHLEGSFSLHTNAPWNVLSPTSPMLQWWGTYTQQFFRLVGPPH